MTLERFIIRLTLTSIAIILLSLHDYSNIYLAIRIIATILGGGVLGWIAAS